jgi:hypothetical protein
VAVEQSRFRDPRLLGGPSCCASGAEVDELFNGELPEALKR